MVSSDQLKLPNENSVTVMYDRKVHYKEHKGYVLNPIVIFAENKDKNVNSISYAFKVNFEQDSHFTKRISAGQSYIFTSDNKVLINYKKIGDNEVSERDNHVEFTYNYNTFEKPITRVFNQIDLKSQKEIDNQLRKGDRTDVAIFSNKIFVDQEMDHEATIPIMGDDAGIVYPEERLKKYRNEKKIRYFEHIEGIKDQLALEDNPITGLDIEVIDIKTD